MITLREILESDMLPTPEEEKEYFEAIREVEQQIKKYMEAINEQLNN